MNDSFLEDLELVTVEQETGTTVHHAERNITRRRSQPSPLHASPDQEELNQLIAKQNVRQKIAPVIAETKMSQRRLVDSKESNKAVRRPVSRETKMENIGTKASERRPKPVENKLKPVDRKDHPRSSTGSNKGSSRCSDGSSRENSHPSDSSKESDTRTETTKERSRGSGDGPTRRRETEEKFEVAMLNSVKEIVSTYTKNESTKILRAMQELYINSQSNLIKLMLKQTDDLATESGKDSPRLRLLDEENKRLKDNIAFLEAHNEQLRKTVEEYEQIKQENLELKNHYIQLLKSGAAKEINRCSDGSSQENNCEPELKKETALKTRARQFLDLYRNPK